MLPGITKAEDSLDILLPKERLKESPTADLLAAAKLWSAAVWDKATALGPIPLSDELLSKGRQFTQHPIFICGVHRSGTTLLRDLLDNHPDLSVLPSEGTYFTNLEFKLLTLPENERMRFLGSEWLRRLTNPINQPPYWLLGRSSEVSSPYVDFARYFMAWWDVLKQNKKTQWPHIAIALAFASYTGSISAKQWVDKTPANERYLKRIWREMPNAKIVHVIRDPLAIIASRKIMEPGVGIRTILRDIKMSFQAALENLNDTRVMIVRYEELCAFPQDTITQLAGFLNISSSASLSQPTVMGMPVQANSSFNQAPAAGQILKTAQHKQGDVLTLEERELAMAYISNIAARLNYTIGNVGFLRGIYLRLKYRLL